MIPVLEFTIGAGSACIKELFWDFFSMIETSTLKEIYLKQTIQLVFVEHAPSIFPFFLCLSLPILGSFCFPLHYLHLEICISFHPNRLRLNFPYRLKIFILHCFIDGYCDELLPLNEVQSLTVHNPSSSEQLHFPLIFDHKSIYFYRLFLHFQLVLLLLNTFPSCILLILQLKAHLPVCSG